MVNLPIYRAKKVDSDEWVEGYLLPPEYNSQSISTDWTKNFYDDFVPNEYEIDPNTLAIHFPDMIKDMFASFDYTCGVGGTKFSFNYHTADDIYSLIGVLVWSDSDHRLEVLVLANSDRFEVLYYDDSKMTNIEVIGIHKGDSING